MQTLEFFERASFRLYLPKFKSVTNASTYLFSSSRAAKRCTSVIPRSSNLNARGTMSDARGESFAKLDFLDLNGLTSITDAQV